MRIKFKLLLIEVASLCVIALLLMLVSQGLVKNGIYERMEETLMVAVEGFNGNVNYLRDMDKDIDITVFEGDTRVESSIPGVVGKKADPKVVEAVLNNGQIYFDKAVDVAGTKYCGYYKPVEGGMLFAGKPTADMDQLLNRIIGILAGITVGILILCVTGTTIFLTFMTNKITRVQHVVKGITEGDLTQKVDVYKDTKDELSCMSNDVARLQQELVTIVSAIHEDTKMLNESSDQFTRRFQEITNGIGGVNQAVEDIAQGATAQASDTTSMTEQVAKMSDAITKCDYEIEMLEAAVSRMNNLFEQADVLLQKMVEINGKTSHAIGVVNSQTKTTNASAKKIQEAVAMIQEITTQTNLLSLNASIEAARAGESGRGFAVVASEIRNLAESSAQSADIIEKIVEELIDNSNESVSMMADVSTDVKNEQSELSDTKSAFENLKTEVSEVSGVSEIISEQMKNLVSSRGIIADATESLSAISEENAAASEETAASMQTLTGEVDGCAKEVAKLGELSENLEKQVAIFKL